MRCALASELVECSVWAVEVEERAASSRLEIRDGKAALYSTSSSNPLSIPRIQPGGMGFCGGVFGFLVGRVFTRLHQGLA